MTDIVTGIIVSGLFFFGSIYGMQAMMPPRIRVDDDTTKPAPTQTPTNENALASSRDKHGITRSRPPVANDKGQTADHDDSDDGARTTESRSHHNEMVLMATYSLFPWKQISPEIVKIEMFIEAYVGDVSKHTDFVRGISNYLIVTTSPNNKNTRDTFRLAVESNTLVLHCLGSNISLLQLPKVVSNFPIGAVRCQLFIIFDRDGSIRIEAKGGVDKNKGPVVTSTVPGTADDVRHSFYSFPSLMYQGDKSVSALRTMVKWTSTRTQHMFN